MRLSKYVENGTFLEKIYENKLKKVFITKKGIILSIFNGNSKGI